MILLHSKQQYQSLNNQITILVIVIYSIAKQFQNNNMETRPFSDFLEVSINAEKFNLFANAIATSLSAHEKLLQQHSRDLIQIRLISEQQIVRIKGEIDYERERMQKKRKQDSVFFSGLINDNVNKHQLLLNECKSKFTSFQKQLNQMKFEHASVSVIKSVQKELLDLYDDLKTTMKEDIDKVEARVKTNEVQLKNSIKTQDFLLKNVIEAYQNKSKNTGSAEPQKEKKPVDETRHIRKPTKIVSVAVDSPTPKERHSPQPMQGLEQATLREGRERRRRKAQDKCEQQNLQYASVSAKIDSLEVRLTAKQNQSLNKVMWAGLCKKNVSSQSSQQNIPCSMEQIEIQRKNLQQNITVKLEHIEQIIYDKFAKDEKELLRLKGVYDLMADEIQIVKHKFQKEKNKVADCQMQLKKVEDKRIDEKMMDTFVAMIKRQTRALEEQVEGKLARELWEKEQEKIAHRLQMLGESMTEKANKDEIRRAFQFVEDKIKEIVLIMAGDAQAQKEGAGRRVPFKCLSCDKDLDNSQPATQRPQTELKGPLRNSTSNLRKRLRMSPNEEK